MAALDEIEWGACLLEPVRDRAVERELRRGFRFVPPAVRYFLDAPGCARAFTTLENVPLRHLSADLVGMIALVVSQDNACRYCYTATRSFLTVLGFEERHIRRLEEDFSAADLTAADKTALDFARYVSRAAPLATRQDGQPLLDAGYNSDAVKEVAFQAAAYNFLNRVTTMPALPPRQAGFGGRWYVRFFRPLVAAFIRSRRAARAEPLRPEQREGPFAEFVNAFDGLPAASRLRMVIDDIWRSPHLGARTKALVFAVVARGIACQPAEQEAVRLLTEAGMPSPDVESALAHLVAPGLDAFDRSAAALARESIWYRPAQLQRHARLLRSQCTRQQFVDLIGTTAAANMVCRLGVVVDMARQGC